MRKINSYARIYQEKIKMKKKLEKKEEGNEKDKKEDEDINLNYELPLIISPNNDQETFNGIIMTIII